MLFDKECQASKVKDFAQLRELVLLEDFNKCLPEHVVIYLNEQKVESLANAAVLTDEFALTHKSVYSSLTRQDPIVSPGMGRARSPQVPHAQPHSFQAFYL